MTQRTAEKIWRDLTKPNSDTKYSPEEENQAMIIIKRLIYNDFDEYVDAFNDKTFVDIRSRKLLQNCVRLLESPDDCIMLMHNYTEIDGNKLSYDAKIFFPDVLKTSFENK